jgi:hypothetical protein
MKIYIKLKLIIFAAFMLIIGVSCDEEQDVSPVQGTDDYPVATFQVGATTVNEGGGAVVPITVTIDKALTKGVAFDAEVTGGTATLHDDFDISNATIPPFFNSATIEVLIHEDLVPEGSETIELQIIASSLANKFLLNPSTVFPTVSITIENYVSPALDMTFDWETGIPYEGDTYSACTNVDLDVFVSDAAGFDIADPWATFNDTNYAASGDCPEHFDMDMNEWGDGEYIIWHENWSNGFAGLDTNTLVPITATMVRAGVFTQVVVQDDSQALNSDWGGEDDEVPFNTHGFIAKVTIANGEFTITDYSGTDLVTGKAPVGKKTPRPASVVRD